MAQPLLSIGMIVKNEERCLEKCLKALEPLRQAIPCELVIADTGSTDKTKKIAEKYADILFDFTWVNDFSVARNAVMDKCSGKWFLTVDADEYLIPDISEITTFLKSSSSTQKLFASIIQRNYNDTAMKGTFTDFNAVRMVRLDSGLRYNGSIHESFPIQDLNTIHTFSNTVFDHDGYTAITTTHLKEKEERNLKLLEKQLRTEPDNIRCILLCLESSSLNPEKRRYYTEYTFRNLQDAISHKNSYWELFAPPCLSNAIGYASEDKHPKTEYYINWAFENFKNSPHINIDVNFYYAKLLEQAKNYSKCIKHCKTYLKELENYSKTNSSAVSFFTSPVRCIHKKHISNINALLIKSLINENKFSEAKKYISQIDLTEAEKDTFDVLVSAIALAECPAELGSMVGNKIGNLLELHHKQQLKSVEPYSCAISSLTEALSDSDIKKLSLNNFSDVYGTVALCVKIATAKTKAEAEEALNKIEFWEDFIPVALNNTIILNATLPKQFYLMNSSRLNEIIEKFTKICNECVLNHTLNYFSTLNSDEWYKVSFAFNLFFKILTSKFYRLTEEHKNTLLDNFCKISDTYLNTCYNQVFLSDKTNLTLLPPAHLFAWYLNEFIKNNKNSDINFLIKLSEQISDTKTVIDFLIDTE